MLRTFSSKFISCSFTEGSSLSAFGVCKPIFSVFQSVDYVGTGLGVKCGERETVGAAQKTPFFKKLTH
jgi:hypothetical protein